MNQRKSLVSAINEPRSTAVKVATTVLALGALASLTRTILKVIELDDDPDLQRAFVLGSLAVVAGVLLIFILLLPLMARSGNRLEQFLRDRFPHDDVFVARNSKAVREKLLAATVKWADIPMVEKLKFSTADLLVRGDAAVMPATTTNLYLAVVVQDSTLTIWMDARRPACILRLERADITSIDPGLLVSRAGSEGTIDLETTYGPVRVIPTVRRKTGHLPLGPVAIAETVRNFENWLRA